MAQHRKYGKKGNKLSNLPCINVLMLNPKVGLILVISSPLSFLRIVVFPALSRPLWRFGNLVMYESWWAYRKSKRISFSFCRFLRMMVSKPMLVSCTRPWQCQQWTITVRWHRSLHHVIVQEIFRRPVESMIAPMILSMDFPLDRSSRLIVSDWLEQKFWVKFPMRQREPDDGKKILYSTK